MRPFPLALLAGVLAQLSGCVTIDATLRADGSARLTMLYRTAPDATEFLARRRFTSAHVRIESVKIFEDQRTVVRAEVDDVAKLGGSKGFESVAVTRARKGRDQRLAIALTGPGPQPAGRDGRPYMTLSVTLPGPVRAASHGAAVLGSRLTWRLTQRDVARERPLTLRVRYTPPPRT